MIVLTRQAPAILGPGLSHWRQITTDPKERPDGWVVFGERSCAAQQRVAADVRFGSKADIAARPRNVRFTPESGHRNRPAYHQLRQLGEARGDPPRLVVRYG